MEEKTAKNRKNWSAGLCGSLGVSSLGFKVDFSVLGGVKDSCGRGFLAGEMGFGNGVGSPGGVEA